MKNSPRETKPGLLGLVNIWTRLARMYQPEQSANRAITGAEGARTMQALDDDIADLQQRIEDLLADNDTMREELWAKDVALRVMAERIEQLEGAER